MLFIGASVIPNIQGDSSDFGAFNNFGKKTWYVSADDGSDENGDGTELNPWLHIYYAVGHPWVSEGDTIFAFNGTYRNEEIHINTNFLSLMGQSKEKTVIEGRSHENNVVIINTNFSFVNITNFTICNGNNAIWALGNNITVSNCTICNSNIGVSTMKTNLHKDCYGLRIIDSQFNSINEKGIAIVSDHIFNVNISNCIIYSNDESIYCYGLEYPIDNTLVNTIFNCTIIQSENGSGIRIKGCGSFNIIKCNVSNNNYNGIFVDKSSKINILDCDQIYSNGQYGIQISDSDSISVANCNLTKNGKGIRIDTGANCNIIGCNIKHNNDPNGLGNGIQIIDSSGDTNTIRNCTIQNNNGNGIEITGDTDGNNIINCTIEDNKKDGIYIIATDNNNIINCTIKNNAGRGIFITSNSSSNTITNCTLEDNTESCIKFEKSPWTGAPSNNLIYGNRIKGSNSNDNGTSAYDNSWNQWCHKGKERGNYWYWYGIDGPDRNKDGIIDGPYQIEGRTIISNEDEYPLKYDPFTSDPLPPTVTIIYPNGGEHLSGEVNISWTANDDNYISGFDFDETHEDNLNISIYYYNETKSDWDFIDYSTNNGLYTWDTTKVHDGMNYRIKINTTDESNNTGSDISSYPFVINNAGLYVSNVIITDTTINSRQYTKNGDDIEVVAVIKSKDFKKDDIDIWADLSEFMGSGYTKVFPYEYNYHEDGCTAIWNLSKITTDDYDDGLKSVNVTASNKDTSVESKNSGSIIVDNTPPKIEILKPTSGLYLFDRIHLKKKIHPFLPEIFEGISFVIGKVTINATAMDSNGISEIIWYLDGKLLKDFGFEWILGSSDSILKIHRIKIIVLDNARNDAIKNITVLKIF